jgi:hypothetical protein
MIPNIPIVGQVFTVIDNCAEASTPITCRCDAARTLRVSTACGTPCPACGKIYQIAELSFDLKTRQWQIKLAIAVPREPPVPALVG